MESLEEIKIKKIGVIGAGQMGQGITEVFAASSFFVLLIDKKKSFLEKAFSQIKQNLDHLIKKNKITKKTKQEILSKIKLSTQLEDLKTRELIIEAVTENFELKKEIFSKLSLICKENTFFCSNTSSISITRLAGTVKNPSNFMGLHFMNPVPVMKLVEGIRALQTSDETFHLIRSLTLSLNKVFVESKDRPGFIVNRILMPMINEAAYALLEGVAPKENIDQAMVVGTHHPMGPLKLADFIGLDTCLFIMEVIYKDTGNLKFYPCPLLRKYVEAGWYGKKTKKGFYDY